MTVSTSKMNCPRVQLLKTLRHSFVKILRSSQKRLELDVFLTGTTKELYNAKNFCVHRYHYKKQMPVEKSFSAVSNVHPVQPAIRNEYLKRQTKFKPRKCHKTQIKNLEVFTNRTYADFCSLELNSYVQMDTVKSSRDSQKSFVNHDLYRGKAIPCISS